MKIIFYRHCCWDILDIFLLLHHHHHHLLHQCCLQDHCSPCHVEECCLRTRLLHTLECEQEWSVGTGECSQLSYHLQPRSTWDQEQVQHWSLEQESSQAGEEWCYQSPQLPGYWESRLVLLESRWGWHCQGRRQVQESSQHWESIQVLESNLLLHSVSILDQVCQDWEKIQVYQGREKNQVYQDWENIEVYLGWESIEVYQGWESTLVYLGWENI